MRTGRALDIYYLEIVTPDVDRHIAMYARAQGLSFGPPVPELGNARIAGSPSGGRIGIRAPMHAGEAPATRPYYRTESLPETVAALEALGAEIAVPPMEIPGQGAIAVYFLDGLQHGLWQV